MRQLRVGTKSLHPGVKFCVTLRDLARRAFGSAPAPPDLGAAIRKSQPAAQAEAEPKPTANKSAAPAPPDLAAAIRKQAKR